jgi:hypothetical protein
MRIGGHLVKQKEETARNVNRTTLDKLKAI